MNLFVVGTFASRKAPAQNIVVGATSVDALTQICILDTEETTAAPIETGTEVAMKIGAQTASGPEPNLIEHPGKINDATGAIECTAWILAFVHGCIKQKCVTKIVKIQAQGN